MTGTKEGQQLLYQCPHIIISLAKLTSDDAETVAKDSLLCLVNLSAEEEGATVLLKNVHLEEIFFFYRNHRRCY